MKFSFLNLNFFTLIKRNRFLSPLSTLLTTLAVVFTLNACSTGAGSLTDTALNNSPASQPGDEKIRIALLLPLSAEGRSAQIAKQIKQAGELALFEADNPNIELITKDTQGTPAGARKAATAAVSEGAEIVLGPLFAASVRAATPVVQQSNVPMIAFSSDESVAGNGVYLLSFLAGHDVSSIVSYAVSQGKRRFSAYLPQDQYGKVAEIAFRNAVASHGGEVVALATYPKDPTGLVQAAKPFAEQVINNQADTIFMPAGQQYLPQLATLIPYYEIDAKTVQILGSSRWDFASVGTHKPLVGGWFPAAEPRGWNQFKQRYTQTYGIIPTRITTLSYDAVSLAVSLANQPKGQRYSVANLTQPGGFAGVDGLFRLNQNGLSERRFAILQVQKFSNKIIKPSPKTFGREAF